MVQEALDLELADELHQQVIFDYSLFLHHLQGYYHPRVNLLSQEDASELSFSQPLNDLKVVLAEGSPFLVQLDPVGRFAVMPQKGGKSFLAAIGAQF